MPQFEYLVKDKQGHDQTGVEEAPDSEAVVQSLRQKGFLIIRIQETQSKKLFSLSLGQGRWKEKGGKVKIDDLVVFSRQLSTLVGAGVPLLESLEVLYEQTEKAKLRTVVRDLEEEVRGGRSFSEALERHPKIFSFLFIHMTRAGESSGNLEEILDRLATYLEKTSSLQRKIRSALAYPGIVFTLALLITMGMLTFVIPKFAEIFFSLNAPLPLPTRVILAISNFIQANFFWVVLGFGVLLFLFLRWKKTQGGRFVWDGFKLKLPIFGPLFLKVAVSKFTRTFATLVKSGVPILSSLEIVAHTVGNSPLERLVLEQRTSVTKGEGLATALSKSALLPPMVVRMIAVGEETGELEKMLVKIADFYDAQVDSAVAALTSLIEPLIITFLGVVIGGIVISMFLPIFTLTQVI